MTDNIDNADNCRLRALFGPFSAFFRNITYNNNIPAVSSRASAEAREECSIIDDPSQLS